MSNYFVKKTGSDANNGTTWALAKATIQAGFNLCTVAGDFLYVAPGRYFEKSIIPPSAGTRASKKSFVGDWNSIIQDGGGNFSGVTQGYVIIDASKQTGTKGYSTTLYCTNTSNNWAYWNIKNLVCTGGAFGLLIYAATGGTATDGTTFENIITESWYEKGLQLGNWTVNPDTGAPITIKNCIGIGKINSATYGGGAYVDNTNAGTLVTGYCYVFERCYFKGTQNGFVYAAGVNNRMRIKMSNCAIISSQPGYANAAVIFNNLSTNNAAYSQIDFYDCIFVGFKRDITAGGGAGNHTYTRCKFYLSEAETVATSEIQPLLWPGIDYLYPGSPIVDANSNNGVFPDIFGNSQQGNADFGAQELMTGVYLREPNAQMPLTSGIIRNSLST